eukprot:gb/GEZJ01002251.1/.p1 GENE.gb/GEZJ01002251.1/~~gb/GEZJ01002251.1/.p1  ORF type:complete len:320 (-),score=72.80 gb/GEZJ01002251.1/:1257-2216(-)
MAGNRNSSYAESSDDDDFAHSDDDKSLSRTRLKRPRRSSTKPRRLAVRSPQTSSFQLDDEDDHVICVPDSLEHDEARAQESDSVAFERGPQNPSFENTMESAAKSEGADAADENENVEASQPKTSANGNDEQPTRSARVLKQRKAYVISDSESEPSAHEDDDAYNSADDSPGEEEEDVASDFQLSPKPSAKKRKANAPSKRSSPPKKGKAQMRPNTTGLKTSTKTGTKTGLKNAKQSSVSAMQRSIPERKKTGDSSSSGSGKKRLGARIPSNSSALSSIVNSAQKPRRPSLPSFPSPLVRSGLSRNVSVPPLHAYLKKG